MGTTIVQCFVVLCIITYCGNAQWLATPTRKRPLPSVIITREHLLREQQPSLYGNHGQTAAEFVVSAGLGPSKHSTAVRVRKLPNLPITSNASNEISRHAYRVPSRRQDGRNNPTYGSDLSRYVPPIFVSRYQPDISGLNQGHQYHRNSPHAYKPEFDNRYDRDHQQRAPARKPELHINRYDRPTNFNPSHYKPDFHVKRTDHLNPVAHSPDLTIRVPERNRYEPPTNSNPANFNPDYNLKRTDHLNPVAYSPDLTIHVPGRNIYEQSTNKPDHNSRIEISERRHYNVDNSGHYIVRPNEENRKPIITSSNSYKPIINPPRRRVSVSTTPVPNRPKVSTEEFELSERKSVEATSGPVEVLSSEKKDNKDVVAETAVLKLNQGKEIKPSHLIRRPSLVLKDQIIVNELPDIYARERFGPRSLDRRKREVSQFESIQNVNNSSIVDASKNEALVLRRMSDDDTEDDSMEPKVIKRFNGYWNPQRKNSINMTAESSVDVASFRPVFDDYEDEHPTKEDDILPIVQPTSKKGLQNYRKPQRNNPFDGKGKKFKDPSRTGRNHPIHQLHERRGRNTTSNSTGGGSVMSFSEFLASPVAEKIRLERQSRFRDSNSTEETANSTARYSYDGNPLWKPSMLRELLASRLLQGLLARNATAPTRRNPAPDEAEQRHYGVVLSPYDGMGSNVMPVIKILRGRIVPLPELPQDLIPLLLDSQRPSHSAQDEEAAALDRAILSLLQSDEFAEKDRDLRYRFNRKSPSTNHVGSVKISEGSNRFYKPADWSLGPRCDRLTEEICLDDSDYPSSAILSSIQKDQTRFELMYAEAKRSSARDGPPREHSVCPSEVHLARPHRARNRAGQWKVVVNVDRYTQTVRMEKCLENGNPCPYVSPRVQPTCTQLYSHHRLLVFSKERGLHIDLFRVPTACACRIQSPGDAASNHYYNVMRPSADEFGGHVETAPSTHSRMPEGSGSKKNLSSTLWSILGGGPKGGVLAQQPQFLEEVQKQVSWTNRLPNISPSQVLKQLLDEDEEYGIRRQRLRPKPIQTISHSSLATPITIPRPPHPPPMGAIPRRPVVGERLFGMPAVKVSLTKDGPPAAVLQEVKAYQVSGPSAFRPPNQEVKAYKVTTAFHRSPQAANDNTRSESELEDVEVKAYKISSSTEPEVPRPEAYRPQRTDSGGEEEDDENYKVKPGMFHSSSSAGQWNEDGPSTFDEGSEGGPIMKPHPMGAHEDDLLAVDKSEGNQAVKVETTTEDDAEDELEEDDARINFSYHPILEYLNF